MSDIFKMKVIENTEKLLDYSPTGVLWEPSIVRLCLLSFQMSVQGLSLDILHY